MDWKDVDAVLFDLDGVLTPTASLHQRAWHNAFEAVLAQVEGVEPYGPEDYFHYVDGRPRYDGVAAVLESRGIGRPWGLVTDVPSHETVCGIGNLKNELFEQILASEGISPFPGSLKLVEFLNSRGMPMAVVSSSRNAPEILQRANLLQYFPTVIDGTVAEKRGLPGKPDPATYLAAADELSAAVERTVVIEDAVSGVRSGREGGFGQVIGVDRGAGHDVLRENGASLVVDDLEELL